MKKELKIKAQDILMSCISKSGYEIDTENLTEKEIKELETAIKVQGDRLAKIFGFDEMWFS